MKETYTYIARSADNPENMAIFTLHDHRMTIEPGGSLQQLQRVADALRSKENPEETRGFPSCLEFTFVWLLEQSLSPFSVADADAEAADGGLRVKAWIRAGGLRVAPIVLTWDRMDNPKAAQAFEEELKVRKASAAYPSRLWGPFDHWVTWFVAGFALSIVLMRQLRSRDKEEQ